MRGHAPVSTAAALDGSVQAIVLNLLDRLRRASGLSFLFVCQALSVVRMIYDRILVVQTGRIVESGPSDQVFSPPEAAYPAALWAAMPHFDPACTGLELAGQRPGGAVTATTGAHRGPPLRFSFARQSDYSDGWRGWACRPPSER